MEKKGTLASPATAYTITPPYKRVTFVPGKASDNSLVKLYASSNGISEDQSRAALTAFLEDIKKVLLDRKTVVFPGLGRLRATRQNNIFFITDESLDIYPEGFGLETVSLKNHEETPAEVHHVVESLAGIMVAPTEEFVEPSGEVQQPAEAPEVAEPAPLIPADERLEFADEPAIENRLEAVDEEGREQKEAKMQHPPVEKQGGASKKAKNAAARREERNAKRQAAKEAKAAAKAEKAAAKTAAKADRAAAKVAAKETRAAAKAERVAAKAARKQARAETRAARKAARKPVPKWIWVTPLVILALAALAAGVFFILVYAAPDFLDSLLYTPEELRIINY